MFFYPRRPPLTTRQRAELELLMRRCLQLLDPAVIRNAVVVGQLSELVIDPTTSDSLFSSAAAEVRQRMRIPDAQLELKFVDEQQQAACYQFGTAEFRLPADMAGDPLRLVTSLAYAGAQHICQSDLDAAVTDQRLCELVALCHGFGVLQSDASLYFTTWSQGEWGGWQASKQGQLTAQEIGYALALLARFRGEPKPSWAGWLRADSKVTLKQAGRYFHWLQRSQRPLLFDAERVPDAGSTPQELANWLTGDDPTFALAAAWRLCEFDRFDALITEALQVATESADLDVVPAVITLLAGSHSRDQTTLERFQTLLRDRRPGVALAATKAAASFGIDLSAHVGTLAWLLEQLPQRRLEILPLVAAQGTAAGQLDSTICRLLVRSLKAVDDPLSQQLADCLLAISGEPKKLVEKVISPGPLRDEAMSWLTGEIDSSRWDDR